MGALWELSGSSSQLWVLEFNDEKLKVYNNTAVGVLTNDPSYEVRDVLAKCKMWPTLGLFIILCTHSHHYLSFTQWQIGNLNEYSAFPTGDNRIGNNFTFNVKTSGQFTNYTVAPSSVGVVSTSTEGHGHGFNTNMLPGSYTAAYRFVKMFFLKQLAAHHSSPLLLEEGIILATGLINTVHILWGVVLKQGSNPTFKTTNIRCTFFTEGANLRINMSLTCSLWLFLKQWVDPKLPKMSEGPTFYYRTYDNMQWKKIKLGEIDWTGQITYAPVDLYDGTRVQEVTPISIATERSMTAVGNADKAFHNSVLPGHPSTPPHLTPTSNVAEMIPPSALCMAAGFGNAGGAKYTTCCPEGSQDDWLCTMLRCVDTESFTIEGSCKCGPIGNAWGQLSHLGFMKAEWSNACEVAMKCCGTNDKVSNEALSTCLATVAAKAKEAVAAAIHYRMPADDGSNLATITETLATVTKAALKSMPKLASGLRNGKIAGSLRNGITAE